MPNVTFRRINVWLIVALSANATLCLDILKALGVRLIEPGTKWCGAGSIAKNDDDLGRFSQLDACCRAHDMCPDSIEIGRSKHGLNNTGLFTRSHCECDDEFHACLKAIRSVEQENAEVTKVGFLYFNVLDSVCFKLAPPARCETARRHTAPFKSYFFPNDGHFSFLRCEKYAYNISDETQRWQWFENPVY